jgi:hypothetical protein
MTSLCASFTDLIHHDSVCQHSSGVPYLHVPADSTGEECSVFKMKCKHGWATVWVGYRCVFSCRFRYRGLYCHLVSWRSDVGTGGTVCYNQGKTTSGHPVFCDLNGRNASHSMHLHQSYRLMFGHINKKLNIEVELIITDELPTPRRTSFLRT